MDVLIILLIALIFALCFVVYRQHIKVRELESKSKSLSVKYGKMTEQFFPFLEKYPYDKENFRFLGNPIDGIQFEDDEIIFVEFKTGSSRLSSRQKKISKIIESGKVKFKEFRV